MSEAENRKSESGGISAPDAEIQHSEAFDLFTDFGNFLKTIFEAKLSYDGDLKGVLDFIERLIDDAGSNCNFEDREGLYLAYRTLERWENDLKAQESGKTDWEALNQAKQRMNALEAGK